MTRRNSVLEVLVWIVLLVCPHAALAQEPTAAGWRTEVAGKSVVLTPTDLAAGEFFQITISPRTPMAGMPITDYLDGLADRTTATLGKPVGTAKPASAKDHTSASATRTFTALSGTPRVAIFIALAVDGENVRVVQTVSDLNAALIKRYTPQVSAVAKEMGRQERAAAQESGRGLQTEELPPTPRGMTPGGKIVPGIYAGNAVYSDTGKIVSRMRLYLYASGECRLCNEKGEDYRFGPAAYSYDLITGKLDVAYGQQYDLYNSVLGPDDAWCLYEHGSDGATYLQADSDHGFGRLKTLLRYVGPPDRPSPKQADAAKAAAEADAKRYKYVTAPGKGVQPAQIAGVLHNQISNLGNGPDKNEVYLLLKDGMVHDGLPVPPDELDVSLSRRHEPEKWGKWRKQGTQILAAWPDNPGRCSALQGFMAVPGRTGERLTGHFATGQTSGSFAFGGSYSVWGVTFTPDGRFEKSGYGGSSSGSLGATMNDFSVNTQSDDEGSTTSFSSPGAVGYTGRKKPGGHRGGVYSLSGYALTLHYDDGRVERTPFFFTDAKRDEIYFEGATLAFDKDK